MSTSVPPPSPLSPPPFDAHFVFLVHGFLGHPDELSYVEEAIESAAAAAEGETAEAESEGEANGGGRAEATAGSGAEAKVDERENGNEDRMRDGVGDVAAVVVRKVACNVGKTRDGVRAGGERLAEEVASFVRGRARDAATMREREGKESGPYRASLSFVGYSLGGLYARYAISALPLEFDLTSGERDGDAEKVVLVPNLFCTVATPHLGLASNGYVYLPRLIEWILGRAFGKTGGDLFRCGAVEKKSKKEEGDAAPGELLYRMATDRSFLDPLADYRHRIACANAFGTDVMVPAATAGMLSPRSGSRHRLCHAREEGGLAVLAFETRPCERPEGAPSSGSTASGWRSRAKDEALAMSRSLDSLGWTKALVDCRGGMPGPTVRHFWRRSRKDLVEGVFERKRSESSRVGERDGEGEVTLESRELWSLTRKSEHWHPAPNGHFIIVAHSKTKRGAKMSARGRPLVRRAAVGLVDRIRRCEQGGGLGKGPGSAIKGTIDGG